MKKVIFFCLIILIAAFSSCKKDNPVNPPVPPGQDYRKITLSEEGRSCSELWVRITADSVELPSGILLKINNIPSLVTLTNTRDTVIYFDSLQTNSLFIFSAVLSSDTLIKSNVLQVNTLAPTSHNFNYQTFEFGDPSTGYSSILYGASIIDENNIWVVGEIYEVDSSGNDIKYNAAHWDGNNWELRIIYYVYNGSEFFRPIRAIFSFNENDIWFSNFTHCNGVDIESIGLNISYPASVYGILGIDNDNIIIVGEEGRIALYDRSSWQSIPSPATLALTDIYSKGNGDIYAAGIDVSRVKGVVLKGDEAGFSVMINSEIISEDELFDKLYGELQSVWVDENGTVYAGGDLLYRYKNNQWNYVTSLPENYIGGNAGSSYRGSIASIRGNGSNDYIIAGGRNTLKHFNGVDWEQIGLPYSPSSPIAYGKVEQKGNIAVAVGWNGNKAFIILLQR